MERIGVIIVAGGSGCRMGTSRPKQFLFLGGRPVLAHAIDRFAHALPGAPIVVVLPEEHIAFWRNLAARFDVTRHTVTAGGAQRFHSVSRGLAALPPGMELIAVHDGVRPLASTALIRRTIDAAQTHGAAVPVVEPVDSFRWTDDAASHPIDRCRLRAVQTPQVFRADLLRNAYETTYRSDFTDDASVVEHSGATVFLCEGDRRNLKITTPDDLLCAEALLAEETSAGEQVSEEGGAATDAFSQNDLDSRFHGPNSPCTGPGPSGFGTGDAPSGGEMNGCNPPRSAKNTPEPSGKRCCKETPQQTANHLSDPAENSSSATPALAPCCRTGHPGPQPEEKCCSATARTGQDRKNCCTPTPQRDANPFSGSPEREREEANLPAPCCGSCPYRQPNDRPCPATDQANAAADAFCDGCPARSHPDGPDCGCARADAPCQPLPDTPQTAPGNKKPDGSPGGCCQRKR